MKKYYLWCYLGLFWLLMPIITWAYGIENYYIDACLQDNGDLVVQEYFVLNGSYNGFERKIRYADDNTFDFDSEASSFGTSKIYNGSDIILDKIMAVDIKSTISFNNVSGKTFSRVASASKGDYGVYTVSNISSGKSFLIYLPSSYDKAFYIKYKIKNIGVLHDDVGELWWKVFGNELTESIAHLEVRVTFPKNQQEFRVWAHGPLHGNVSKESNQVLLATIDGLDSHTDIDVRSVFERGVLGNAIKTTNVKALSKILLYEEDMANQANYEREQLQKQLMNKIDTRYQECDDNPTRYCYDNVSALLDDVLDQNFKDKYQKKMTILKNKVVVKEENDARNATRMALENKEYFWYNSAKQKVDILENKNLKNELSLQLESVLAVIMKDERRRENINLGVSLGMIIVVLTIYLVNSHKYKHRYDYLFNHKYYRDFPDESSPTTVGYLLHKKVTNDAVSAEILHLINNKVISYEKNIDNDDYVLVRNDDYHGGLTLKDEKLLDLLLDGGHKVSLSDMKKKAKKSYNKFYNRWIRFNNEALKEGKRAGFYDDRSTGSFGLFGSFVLIFIGIIVLVFSGLFGLLLIGLGIFWLVKKWHVLKENILRNVVVATALVSGLLYFFLLINNLIYNHFLHQSICSNLIGIVVSLIVLVVTLSWRRMTLKGEELLRKWQALGNFMEDFGTMDTKDLPAVILWEKYLVYALVLGCADKLSKVMEIKLNEMNISDQTIINYHDLYRVNRLITSSFNSSVKAASYAHSASNINSSSSGGNFSSGSGGGGGFSSGSGGGGGGGGGRF